ncbi:MAG: ImuA family protein [Pirellulaceae bacterium]
MSTARTAPHVSPPAIIDSLRQQIRRMETLARADDARVISTGCRELDQLLPAGGLGSGTITEWLTPAGGQGAELLSLLAAREACADGGALVIIDPDQSFYAPAAVAWGINLDNTIVLSGARDEVRGARKASPCPSRASSLASHSVFWAIDQALRCPAVGAVWGRLDRVNQRWLRRFQLSAEQSGAAGMFVRPASVQGQPGWSEVQWLVAENRSQVESRESQAQPSPAATRASANSVESRSLPVSGEVNGHRSFTPAPVQRAYQRAWRERQHRGREKADAAFDRTIHLQLVRVRGGPPLMHRRVTVRIDFTTGKLHATVANHESPQYHTRRTETGAMRVAAELAHSEAGGRRQRA